MPVKWRKVLFVTGGIVLLMLAALVAHIVAVTAPGKGVHADLQLGRIDFPDTLTELQRTSAMSAIREIQGIDIAKINSPGTNLVYSFPTGQLTCEEVFRRFTGKVNFPAAHYKAPSITKATGCPVIDKSSLTYRFSIFIRNTFHQADLK